MAPCNQRASALLWYEKTLPERLPTLTFILFVFLNFVLSLSVSDVSHVKDFAGESRFPAVNWSLKKMRTYLATFAKNRNLDPLVPNTWRQITEADLSQDRVRPPSLLFVVCVVNSLSCAAWTENLAKVQGVLTCHQAPFPQQAIKPWYEACPSCHPSFSSKTRSYLRQSLFLSFPPLFSL